MRRFRNRLAILTPALALAAGGATGAGASSETPRALALSVIEHGDNVELELIANSQVAQQVQYSIELIGNSTSRHRGDTSIPAGERQILSRMKSSIGEHWCARVHVTEGNGAHYTLTAGDCSA